MITRGNFRYRKETYKNLIQKRGELVQLASLVPCWRWSNMESLFRDLERPHFVLFRVIGRIHMIVKDQLIYDWETANTVIETVINLFNSHPSEIRKKCWKNGFYELFVHFIVHLFHVFMPLNYHWDRRWLSENTACSLMDKMDSLLTQAQFINHGLTDEEWEANLDIDVENADFGWYPHEYEEDDESQVMY